MFSASDLIFLLKGMQNTWQEVWRQRLPGKAGANKVNFAGGDLQEGIYLYKVETNKETFTGRMVLHR